MTLIEIVEKFWPLVVAFLGAGGTWYWKNKKTKTGKRLEVLESESKELANLKTIVDIVQNDLQNELKKKNNTIEELSNIIIELNKKIETLSNQIKELNKKLNIKSEHFVDVEELANKCKIRTAGEVCLVLQHLEKNKLIKNDKSVKAI